MTASGVSDDDLQDPVLFVATYMEVGRRSTDRGADLLRHERDTTVADDGLLAFDVLQRIDRPSQFVVLSAWSNEQALEAHRGAPHVAQLNADLLPLLVAPYDSRQHRGLSVGETSAPDQTANSLPPRGGGLGRGGICVVTHVDVAPLHKNNAVVALNHVADDCRKQQGNLRFDVWQQTDRGNHFTIVETWDSDDAFWAHLMAPGARVFRHALATMLGALYDERLYATLD